VLGIRRWAAATSAGGEGKGAGAGAALPLTLVMGGSRDAGWVWSRCGYGELGNARFLNANGVVSAGPTLPTGVLISIDMRGDWRLNAAAEMVRAPGGSSCGERDEEEVLLVGPVTGDALPSIEGRGGDSEGVRKGDSNGVRYGDPVLEEEKDETERSGRLMCGGGTVC